MTTNESNRFFVPGQGGIISDGRGMSDEQARELLRAQRRRSEQLFQHEVIHRSVPIDGSRSEQEMLLQIGGIQKVDINLNANHADPLRSLRTMKVLPVSLFWHPWFESSYDLLEKYRSHVLRPSLKAALALNVKDPRCRNETANALAFSYKSGWAYAAFTELGSDPLTMIVRDYTAQQPATLDGFWMVGIPQ